jgi:hypothetical protein
VVIGVLLYIILMKLRKEKNFREYGGHGFKASARKDLQ